MNAAARRLVAALGLRPLPHEGGFFRRLWVAPPARRGGRPAASAIYFLLTRRDFSALHRIDAHEIWHFHAGDAIDHVRFGRPGRAPRIVRIGNAFARGEVPQVRVPAGVWQGARLVPGGRHGWALVGCTCTPAWTAAGAEFAGRAEFVAQFPRSAELIRALTR